MTKGSEMIQVTLTVLMTVFASVSYANTNSTDMFATCEHVSDMAVLAKDNVPFFTANRNSNVKSCYADIKEFVAVASADEVAQFNAEYDGQIVIYTTDAEFAAHVTSQKSEAQAFVMPSAKFDSLTPVIKPFAPTFFAK